MDYLWEFYVAFWFYKKKKNANFAVTKLKKIFNLIIQANKNF